MKYLFFVFILILSFNSNSYSEGTSPRHLEVLFVEGDVEVFNEGQWSDLKYRMKLSEGSKIRTRKDSLVKLLIDPEVSVGTLELKGNTALRISKLSYDSSDEKRDTLFFDLAQGTIRVGSKNPKENPHFVVRTPTANINIEDSLVEIVVQKQ